jgi:hypothetical protein
MAETRTEQPADPQPATASDVRPVAPAASFGDLSPSGVLALQRTAGNRVARQVIAGRGGPGSDRILAREKSLDDQVFDLTQKITGGSAVTDALKQQAKALAATCWAGGKASDVDAARGQVKRIIGAMMNNGAQDTGIDIAAATADAEVEKSALAALGVNSISGLENYLVKAGRMAGVTITGPTANQKTNAWLDANTEKIGQALGKLQSAGVTGMKQTSLSQEVIAQMLATFFRAATDAEGDIKPDPMGTLGKLNVDAGTGEIVGDCDVWATYGARLFRAIGWTTVSYMSVIPADTDRAGHAVVLVRSDNAGGSPTFAGVSDFTVTQFTATTEAGAKDELLKLALDIYSARGIPSKWKSYYVAAGPGGKYDVKILDPVAGGLTPWKTAS